ncbi:MAG: DUF6198 family protein [Lachnospiraceae bacterium]|nr:DUF6198 family protein [Lachnospiraceae bacterium]MDY4969153.1 DUF6198 family protein [Lachnospiraceae bacterium]
MSKKELFKRYALFLVGLFINSFGISFITKAGLGTSPISSVPYTLSLAFGPTIGEFTIIVNLLLIVFQVILLGKQFKLRELLQIPVSFLLGYFLDISMGILDWMDPQNYVMQVLCLLIGCLILGFGVYTEFLADVVMLPGEAFVRAITQRFHTEVGNTKIGVDSSMVICAVLISLAAFHGLQGVREGTVITAMLIGTIVRFCMKHLVFLPKLLFPEAVGRDAAGLEAE